MRQAGPMRALHWSMDGKRRAPAGFGSVQMGAEAKEAITNLALDTFTRMTNNGNSFNDALLAVYMTGLENGSSAATEAM